MLTLTSFQTASTHQPNVFRMTMDFLVTYTDGRDTLLRLRQEVHNQLFRIPVSGKIKSISIDPYHWNLEKVNAINYVGINEQKNPAFFSMGPVPVSNILYLRFQNFTTEPRHIIVTDINGRSVFTTFTTSKTLTINTHMFKKGLYVVRVESRYHNFTRKFIR
jgi:hypothetical protein